ncbi:uncharacterized protein LOC121370066 [Gigantopelta aegis]|uniref:uncharacterized protein LOC121370066 n=1 Tax=Gigantopelta aegis TaxID=1735272 RepID=UPI001B88C98B|nr:uncharacterized protein LOC121370066 [Gigantopelta aegis]
MGCRKSKLSSQDEPEKPNKATKETDGSEFTQLGSGRLPLDARQVFKLKQSWRGIKRRIEETGVEMFIRFFKTNLDMKLLFQNFKNIGHEDELRENELLEHHATLVMTTLDDAISNIDNHEYVAEFLKKTGSSHIRFDGFSHRNFWKMKEPFLESARITLGDRYTASIETVYVVAITFILQSLSDGLREHEKYVDVDELREKTSHKDCDMNENANVLPNSSAVPVVSSTPVNTCDISVKVAGESGTDKLTNNATIPDSKEQAASHS